ncbi:hypothetical protein ACFSRY_16770 [Pontibacter locisalis]|uniref:Uncharacterized protein n=1 Tax=Pontibacter locisalis TaxID=1719035 RepID=A0ABW5IQF6_9BACT
MTLSIRSLFFAICLFAFISCTDQEAQQERDQALNDYRNFVTQVEEDAQREYTETELRAMEKAAEDDSRWETESAEVMQKFDDQKRKVVQNIDLYDEAEQQEVRELEERYNRAYQQQKEKYQEVSRRYRLRRDLLGLRVNADDMSSITAEELPATYERFVQNLEPKATELEGREWELVEGWWVALNNRKRALENELSADAKSKIEKASERYRNIRQETKIS